jgi:hypothetical protein
MESILTGVLLSDAAEQLQGEMHAMRRLRALLRFPGQPAVRPGTRQPAPTGIGLSVGNVRRRRPAGDAREAGRPEGLRNARRQVPAAHRAPDRHAWCAMSIMVQDIAQESFIRAYRALPQFRGDSAFYTWLYRIAINTAKKALMELKRDPTGQ